MSPRPPQRPHPCTLARLESQRSRGSQVTLLQRRKRMDAF